ncbi:MAG: hypothetical protein CR982_03160 [Candidatus Cloacimonadota bacterium]|nr:MAG: hypothetical protein CR982_03160 [Candidatus Cloacimonadota bacterium]PIE77425.1 MAG: hypothetical protein CSA15_13175 [Candidatus Delongbacteria bacterium]
MVKLLIVVLVLISTGLMGSEFRINDNLNLDFPSVNYISSGDEIFGFLPTTTQELTKTKSFFGMVSINVTKGGDYTESVKRLENIDPLKTITLVWNHRKDFIPYISYHTPYRAIFDRNLDREFHLKLDRYSLGFISNIGKNCVSMGIDYNVSGYKEVVSGSEDPYYYEGGVSFRAKVDLVATPRTSIHVGASTKPFLVTRISDKNDNPFSFFTGTTINTVFSYRLKDWDFNLSTTYREFPKTEDLLNSWVLEGGIIGSYKLQDELIFSASYYYIPSAFADFDDLEGVVHRVGGSAKIFIDRFHINLGVLDSSLLSKKNLSKLTLKVDLAYNFGR